MSMADQTKKISFGFSKLAKKPAIVSTHVNKKKDEVSKVEFIDCLEGKSIKLKDPVNQDQGPLIIPLTRTKEEKSLNQQVNSDIVESKDNTKGLPNISIKEPSETGNEGSIKSHLPDQVNKNDGEIKQETLDDIAAREILEELNRKKAQDEEKRVFSVPLTNNAPAGEKESTLEDYESVPVGDFGLAMLRGMGWAPGKGIGKTEKLVAPTLPTLRPKGMGLGADKVLKPVEKKSSNEDLKMVKGSFIRVLAGSEKDAYGQIEGFDDESGRLIVKLALKNVSISLNEFMVQLVDTNEFKKNSKVINASKYEKYKEDEVQKDLSGKRLQQEVNEKPRDRVPLSSQTEKFEDKSKTSRKHHSSSNSEADDVEDSRSKMLLDSPESKTERLKKSQNRSPRSPSSRNRIEERSQSRSHKYQAASSEASSKYHKSLTSDNRKQRSNSSDSSDSYRNSKIKYHSSKTKKSVKDKSVSRKRSTSSSSFSSSSSEQYSRKKKSKHKLKKSSSNKYRSRSRSQSPRKHKYKKKKKHC